MSFKNWLLVALAALIIFLSAFFGALFGYKIAESNQLNFPITKFCNKTSKKTTFPVLETNIIPDVAESVMPWVVNIKIEYSSQINPYISSKLIPFSPDGTVTHLPDDMKAKITGGSGVIISKDGYILTNSHVISDAKNIEVNLSTGKSYKAKVIGVDNITDIAVLKINKDVDFPVAKFGNSSKIRIGEWVIAVGSPLGYDQTVTQGIISAINRKVRDIPTSVDFIQTDAAINPGNSGGPLIDLSGKVIGINTAVRADAQNIGFAIPVNTAKRIADQIINEGYVSRPWVGIEVKEFYPFAGDDFQVNFYKGVMVDRIWPGSPAEKGGLRNNDLIVKVDGHLVDDVRDVQEKVRDHKIGEIVKFNIIRNNQKLSFSVKTEKLPKLN